MDTVDVWRKDTNMTKYAFFFSKIVCFHSKNDQSFQKVYQVREAEEGRVAAELQVADPWLLLFLKCFGKKTQFQPSVS